MQAFLVVSTLVLSILTASPDEYMQLFQTVNTNSQLGMESQPQLAAPSPSDVIADPLTGQSGQQISSPLGVPPTLPQMSIPEAPSPNVPPENNSSEVQMLQF